LTDGLAELDRARLEADLEHCPSCRMFSDEITAATSTLRDAPLEDVRFRVSIPRRRLMSIRALQAGAAAAAVALVAGLTAIGGLTAREASGPSVKIGPYATDRGDELIPGKGHFRIKPERLGGRIAA